MIHIKGLGLKKSPSKSMEQKNRITDEPGYTNTQSRIEKLKVLSRRSQVNRISNSAFQGNLRVRLYPDISQFANPEFDTHPNTEIRR
jgi:aspartate carbamoyltransferase regulatory subunit